MAAASSVFARAPKAPSLAGVRGARNGDENRSGFLSAPGGKAVGGTFGSTTGSYDCARTADERE